MSFIPGEGTNVFPLQAAKGSGINLTQVGPTTQVTAALIPGPGITLTPSLVNNTIEISAPPGPAGIQTLTSANGSGVNVTPLFPPTTVQLAAALVPGAGISLTPSGVNKDITIDNTATLTTPLSSGLQITGTAPNYAIDTALVQGAGISITNDPNSTQGKLITNTGVLSLSAGVNSGVSLSQNTGVVAITNTNPIPVASSTAGGIAVGAGQVISLDLNQGSGISIANGPGLTQKTITNTGVLSVIAGSGIQVSPTNGKGIVTVTNNGVRTLTVNAPIQNVGTATNPILSLGPLTGGLKVSQIVVSNTVINFPLAPLTTGRQLFNGILGSAFYNDFLNSTPIADPNGTWVINFQGSMFFTSTSGLGSVALGISPSNSDFPSYILPNLMSAQSSPPPIPQYLSPGQVALPVNAIKSGLGGSIGPTLSLKLINNLSTTIQKASNNTTAFAIYYPNGVQ